MAPSRQLAIVEDCAATRTVLAAHCAKRGDYTAAFEDGTSFVRRLADVLKFDAVLLDIELGDLDGYEVLARIRELGPRPPVIVVTANNEAASVVRCLRLGADDYITKPVDFVRLDTSLAQVIRHSGVARRLELATEKLRSLGDRPGIVARSSAMLRVLSLVDRARESNVTVLLLGESGTGKEVIARSLHSEGSRREHPFIAVNCAAIPASLLEDELFGHEAGAFTGALQTHPGKFEQAGSGTLFLDEIGDMPLAAQASFLRVLESRTVTRIGGTRDIPIHARIICATHRNLRECVHQGSFREDLYWRIGVFPIELPPLRERPEDIPALIVYLIERLAPERERITIDPACLAIIERYPWPGNIRELHHAIERGMLLTDHGRIEPKHLPDEVLAWSKARREANGDTPSIPITFADVAGIVPMWRIEQAALQEALKVCGGDVLHAAERLQISRGTIYRRLKSWDIDADSFRSQVGSPQ